MKPGRFWWPIYLACSVAVLIGLGWITVRSVALERSERVARAENEHQNALRLSLWRIDSWLGPLLALEASRPYTEYLEDRAVGQFEESPDFVLVHFQVGANGRLTSPELSDQTSSQAVREQAESHLAAVARVLSVQELAACVSVSESSSEPPPAQVPESELKVNLGGLNRIPDLELSKRQGAAKNLAKAQTQALNAYPSGSPLDPARLRTRVGAFIPLWFPDRAENIPHLMFVRRVVLGGEDYFQGFSCSWEKLQDEMREQVIDLLDQAQIVPLLSRGDSPSAPAREADPVAMLATVPASIVAPFGGVDGGSGFFGSTRIVFALSWLAVLGGLVAVGVAFQSAMALAEKRARFVAAVTHELRTPLTTFQLYTDMLSRGMVSNPKQRDDYIETLRDESERLGRLVENVLSYSQLEQGRSRSQVETVEMGDLLDRLSDTLVRRAENEGLRIEFDVGRCRGVEVKTDVDAVGQILLNLIDNACKYSGSDVSRPLTLRCLDKGSAICLEVADHGKGISSEETALVFTAFERGQQVQDRPGIGLGLALSRGLAQKLGGELRLLPEDGPGACFELTIPK